MALPCPPSCVVLTSSHHRASRDLRGSTLGWHDALRAPPPVCSRTCGASGFLGRSRRDGHRFPVRRCDLAARRGSISSRGARAGAGVTLPPAGGPLTGGRFHCGVRCAPTAFSRSKRSPQGSGSGARAAESPVSPRGRTGRSCAPGFVCVTRLHFTTRVTPAPRGRAPSPAGPGGVPEPRGAAPARDTGGRARCALGPAQNWTLRSGSGGEGGGQQDVGESWQQGHRERGQAGGLGQHCRVRGPVSSRRCLWFQEGPGRPGVGVRQRCWAPGTRDSRDGGESGDFPTPPAGVGVLRCHVPSG